MIVTDLRQITERVGGEVRGLRAYVPGPGHSRDDRSLAVWLCSTTPLGVMTHSFAGDPWPACNDYLAAAIGAGSDYWRTARRADPAEIQRLKEARRRSEVAAQATVARRQASARMICREGQDPFGTPVEMHLNRRRLALPVEVANVALFYHPACPWGTGHDARADCATHLHRHRPRRWSPSDCPRIGRHEARAEDAWHGGERRGDD